MADVDAVAYLYSNVGIAAGADVDAVAYLYENVGASGVTRPWLGTIHPRIDDTYGVAYLYENVT